MCHCCVHPQPCEQQTHTTVPRLHQRTVDNPSPTSDSMVVHVASSCHIIFLVSAATASPLVKSVTMYMTRYHMNELYVLQLAICSGGTEQLLANALLPHF